jgi:SEC-C motif
MPKLGRNDGCPCGSGAKVKRCCGTREAKAAQGRKAAALGELMTLPVLFPRLRPRGEAFAAWADRVATTQLEAPPLDEGLRLIDAVEGERIGREHAQEHPRVWRSLVDELGDEELARAAVVRGAIAAGVWERRALGASALELLEESLDEGAAEALALVLDPNDLWSAFESSVADAALLELDDELEDETYEVIWNATVIEQARRLREPWHDARLAELVGRVRSRLPLHGDADASATLARACEDFERDAGVRARLAELLLIDSLGRLAFVPALAA